MRDLTSSFLNALAKKGDWSALDVVNIGSKFENGEFDWDSGDERWARVIKDRKAVALICAKVPLLFVQVPFDSRAHEERLEVCTFSTFDEVVCVQPSALEKVFGDYIIADIDFAALSVMDLWWATV